jgi:hypothetical protein
MKIEIDFEDTEEVKLVIGDRELKIRRDCGVTTLEGVSVGLQEDSLGGIIAGALFSKIGDIAGALEDLEIRYIDDPWKKLPNDIAEIVFDAID